MMEMAMHYNQVLFMKISSLQNPRAQVPQYMACSIRRNGVLSTALFAGPGPDYRDAPMTTILQTELNKLQVNILQID